jgi:hypothetical protein
MELVGISGSGTVFIVGLVTSLYCAVLWVVLFFGFPCAVLRFGLAWGGDFVRLWFWYRVVVLVGVDELLLVAR